MQVTGPRCSWPPKGADEAERWELVLWAHAHFVDREVALGPAQWFGTAARGGSVGHSDRIPGPTKTGGGLKTEQVSAVMAAGPPRDFLQSFSSSNRRLPLIDLIEFPTMAPYCRYAMSRRHSTVIFRSLTTRPHNTICCSMKAWAWSGVVRWISPPSWATRWRTSGVSRAR